ncbi:MAG: alcohol dehydrogenase catalytic domain-containing protein [Verrucomicrobiales bacterium]|nr:alcohol dehydrogenase catalytic domain-containing protein [Verrucomicrobiales bacterium]
MKRTRGNLESGRIPGRMSALVYRGGGSLKVESIPVPRIGSHEVLVQVRACGVCPTDIKKIRRDLLPPPRVYGHETAGVIVRVGASVRGFHPGDRVALHHHVPCLDCHFCRRRAFAQCAGYRVTGVTAGFEPAGGGFAEYVCVKRGCLPGMVRIPKDISFAEAALLEPVNTVLKAVNLLGVVPGDHVLVVGQGPIGLLFNRLLTLRGASVSACDPLELRRRIGQRFGARRTFPTMEAIGDPVKRMTRGRGLDAVVLAAPSDEAFCQAQKLVRGGGAILVFAHTVRGNATPLDLGRVCVDEQRVLGSYSSDFTLQDEVARLVFSRTLDVRPLITHRYPLTDAAAAIDRAATPSADTLKVVVEPGLRGQ